MILLSPGGDNIQRVRPDDNTLAVATTDGVFILQRDDGGEWQVGHHALAGCFVSALTAIGDDLFAATHGIGMARSRDGGKSWQWINNGITQFDFWCARAGTLGGRKLIFAGTMPAHLFVSADRGDTWTECTGLRAVPSAAHWCFPPPPRLGHVKDIVLADGRLFVGIEIGALLVSDDEGRTFTDLRIDPDPAESDVHRVLVHPEKPDRILVSNGLMGLMRSEDRGASWMKDTMPSEMNYPDAYVMHPGDPDLLFVSAAVGWPPHWYKLGRARGKIARSRDGGRSWTRLLGGLPDGQRALFGAMTIAADTRGFAVYAADTDGQVFESTDGGDHWHMIAELAPVSKGDFYRAMAKGRPPIANLDDMAFNKSATARIASTKV